MDDLEKYCIFASMKKTIGIIAISALTLMGCATQQERAERRELMRSAVTEAVGKRLLHIDVTSMNTLRYGSRSVTPDFFLELKGDTLLSYLPYLGQAHQAPMISPSQGLHFEAPILSYKLSQKKAHVSQIEIDVKTQEDSYHYRIELYDTGQAYIHVRSQNRDPISFDGHMKPE